MIDIERINMRQLPIVDPGRGQIDDQHGEDQHEVAVTYC